MLFWWRVLLSGTKRITVQVNRRKHGQGSFIKMVLQQAASGDDDLHIMGCVEESFMVVGTSMFSALVRLGARYRR